MRVLLWLLLIFGACAWADEAADRAAIRRAIARLNEVPQSAELFTTDADCRAVLEQLWRGRRLAYRARSEMRSAAPLPPSGHPTVTISHEPWGEATIGVPGGWSLPPIEMLNPRIEGRSTRFITPDVALADAVCTYREAGTAQTTSLLLVMKREGNDWRIASLRVLAEPAR
jgi:hypothetical protein